MKVNYIAVMPCLEQWMTGGTAYCQKLFDVLGADSIFYIRKMETFGLKVKCMFQIAVYVRKQAKKEYLNVLLVDSASLFLMVPTYVYCVIFGVKVVPIHHHMPQRAALSTLVFKFLLLFSKRILVSSQFAFDQIEKPQMSHVLINPTLKYTGVMDAKPKILEQKPKFNLLYIGSVIERKNLMYMLSIVKRLPPQFHLTVCGPTDYDEPYSQKCCDYAAENKLSEQVDFLGKVSEHKLESLYKEADLFVFLSSYEGFGMVNIEAMSFGLPIILSDIPPHRDIVQDGTYGFLFGLDCPNEISAKILALSQDKSDYFQRSSLALERAKTYVWNNSAIQKKVFQFVTK
ncbi:hypothetical protein DID80_02570 [Candidatus Marinamargulisbacteria bacterium SCGC AAA071-K20]|nr:hypothetical protein DID80_02570 [Candidatus Marinamargulisbacteria bacterium SCGC AAA071-K20]